MRVTRSMALLALVCSPQFWWRAITGWVLLMAVVSYSFLNYMMFCPPQFDWSAERIAFVADPQMEGTDRELLQGWYGVVNNRLNDFMYRTILRNIVQQWRPSLVVVLGDIFSNQMISNREFEARVRRYRHIIEPAVAANITVLTIPGNHDIGYGSEVNPFLLGRFENAFGPATRTVHVAGHALVLLNSQVLEGARSRALQDEVWTHVRQRVGVAPGQPVLLATHIPLHKDDGCADRPDTRWTYDGFVEMQNMLSPETSLALRRALRPVLVFTGHDRVGCLTHHPAQGDVPSTDEHTVRSMMGDYARYAALLEVRRRTPSGSESDDGRQASALYEYGVRTCHLVPTLFESILLVCVLVAIGLAPIGLLLRCCCGAGGRPAPPLHTKHS